MSRRKRSKTADFAYSPKIRLIRSICTANRSRTKPLVAAVHGKCLTLGIELLLASDVRIAAENATFAQIEIKRGIFPFGGATLRFPEAAGWGNAMRWLLTGDEFDAKEALRIGLGSGNHRTRKTRRKSSRNRRTNCETSAARRSRDDPIGAQGANRRLCESRRTSDAADSRTFQIRRRERRRSVIFGTARRKISW